MDCPDARLLLAYRRHGGPAEFAPEDAAALDRHLAGCPGCAAAARRQDRFDAAVAGAMRAVVVPAGLRDRLITDALARRGAAWRRAAYRYATAAAAAVVAALTLTGGVLALRPVFDTDLPATAIAHQTEAPEQSVREFLTGQGLPESLPYDFNFALLDRGAGLGYEEIDGRMVPRVVFQLPPQQQPGAIRPDFAKVYIVRQGHFKLNPDKFRNTQNSFCTVLVVPDNGRGVGYVVVFTTLTLDPFLKPDTSQRL
jgi:hypothetical protein